MVLVKPLAEAPLVVRFPSYRAEQTIDRTAVDALNRYPLQSAYTASSLDSAGRSQSDGLQTRRHTRPRQSVRWLTDEASRASTALANFVASSALSQKTSVTDQQV